MVFNPSKLRFGRKVVDCAGFTVTDNWFSADQEDVGGDCKLSQTCERDWSHGVVRPGNQVAYSFAQTEEMAPFRDLLKRNRQFFWKNNMDTFLERAQVKIVEEWVKRL